MIKITRGWPAEPEPRRGKGWPPARRAAQRERILARKPWLKSTGPKTAAGKARVRFNGLKHHRRSAAWRRLKGALRLHRQYIQALNHQRRRERQEQKYLSDCLAISLTNPMAKLILHCNKLTLLPNDIISPNPEGPVS